MATNQPLFASSTSFSSNYVLIALVSIGVIFLLGVIFIVADNLLKVEARRTGIDDSNQNFGIFPKINEIFRPTLPDYVEGRKVNILQKGHDIMLAGEAIGHVKKADHVKRYAVQPPNFNGISPIPKLMAEIGDTVKTGDPLFFDKLNPDVKYCTPVSGEIVEVNRGEKRRIVEVVILADKEQQYRQIDAIDLNDISREDLVAHLVKFGVWPLIKQRPYNVLPDIGEIPSNIFISTFDTAPLAPNLNIVVDGRRDHFQDGLDVLNRLTNGAVYLGLDGRTGKKPGSAFLNASGVEKVFFHGKHPAGNVGVQIHHIAPMSTSEKVWTLGVQEVITIGTLISEQRFTMERVVALTGSEIENPRYVETYAGANIGELIRSASDRDNVRIISGDVLSGEHKSASNYLNAFDDQVTVIKEGNYHELLGWLVPHKLRPSVSKTFPSFLFPDTRFEADTNTHGEERAFVVTGQYEKVLPMDIYPQHLMKAIMIRDFERMEGLGIHELVEEDVALCEFVCTSKVPLQEILREGLDYMREQG